MAVDYVFLLLFIFNIWNRRGQIFFPQVINLKEKFLFNAGYIYRTCARLCNYVYNYTSYIQEYQPLLSFTSWPLKLKSTNK